MNCLLCRLSISSRWGICSNCSLHLISEVNVCYICGLPKDSKHFECSCCKVIKPNWQQLISVADYQPPFINLIKQFKSYQKTEFGYMFARLMLLAWLRQKWRGNVVVPDIITCIPLHRQRYWRRGYNQSELLAKPIAHWIGGKYRPYLLHRIATKQQQKRLSKRQRIENMHHVFSCDKPLAGKNIALIDDVVTTGSTIKEACRVLKSQGAEHIQIICLCRTGL